MFESVLLFKCAEYLSTSDNQFGFKSSNSTDLCIYTLKEFIDYYKSKGTTVHVTFLDASKAFDRIDHWLLFNNDNDNDNTFIEHKYRLQIRIYI